TKPLQFHRRGHHRKRLPGTDDVSEQRVMSLEDAPYSRLLMRVKLDCAARAGERQVLAVEGADAGVVEGVVVKPQQPFAARIFLPYPFLESFFDALLLFP